MNNMSDGANREYLIAVHIINGIILLIEPDGSLGEYRQRGIQTLSPNVIKSEIRNGKLNAHWKSYPELPKNYSITFEDAEIMGRALATYPLVLKIQREKRKHNT